MIPDKHTRFQVLLITIFLLLSAGSMSLACAGRESSDRVRIATLPEALVPDAEVDASGSVHVVYLKRNHNVYYVRSDDNARTFTEPIRVNSEDGFASGGLYRGPDVAVDAEGTVHVVWYNDAYAQRRDKDQWGVMYARLESGSRSFEPSRNLNGRPSDNYSVAVGDSGRVAVLWSAGELFASISRDGGETFAPETGLEDLPCECCGTRAQYWTDHGLYYLYRDREDNNRDMYLGRYGGDRPRMRVKLNSESWHLEACPMSGSSFSIAEDSVRTAWESFGKVFAETVSRLDGESRRGEHLISEKGKYPIILHGAEDTVVAWKEGRSLAWAFLEGATGRMAERDNVRSNNRDRIAGVVTKAGEFVLFN